MEREKSKRIAVLFASLIVLSLALPITPSTLADTGGPVDSGDDTPEGLSIFNNSGINWVLEHGNDLNFNDSLIHMDGNITLLSCSNLTLVNCTLNITGWIDVQQGSRLIMVNSTINFNQTGYCDHYLRILNASLDISGPGDVMDPGYYSVIRTNNSRGFEFNATGSWINISNARVDGPGNGTPINEYQRGMYLRECRVDMEHVLLDDCHDGLVSEDSNLTLSNSSITGEHAVMASGGTLHIGNTTINTSAAEMVLAGMYEINCTDVDFVSEEEYDVEITDSEVYLNASEGHFELLNSTYPLLAITDNATVDILYLLDIAVEDDQGQPYAGAVVSIRDREGSERDNLTLPTGTVTGVEITSMEINSTTTLHHNPHNFTAMHPASISRGYTEEDINASSTITLTLPPSEYVGDWNISGNITLTNKTIVFSGNINISSGSSLTLVNTTIQFEPSTDGQFLLYGNHNSSLHILDGDDDPMTPDGSELRSGTDAAYIVYLNRTRSFTMRNSLVRDCGYYSPVFPMGRSGLFVLSNDSVITGSSFVDCHTGLLLVYSRNATVSDNTFTSENGLMMLNTHGSNISGNTFQGERNDIYMHISQDNRVDNNTFLGTYNSSDMNSTAIELWYAQNITIYNNSISGKGNTGISITLSGRINASSNRIASSHLGINVTRLSLNNLLRANTISEVDVGINLNNSKTNSIESNVITKVNDTAITGFSNRDHSYLYNIINDTVKGATYANTFELLFHNNTITNATDLGIELTGLSDGNITNNTLRFCNNRSLSLLDSGKINLTFNYMINETGRITNTTFHTLAHVIGRMDLLNSTWGTREIFGESKLIERWYLHVRVKNSLGLPVPGATVTLFDIDSTEVGRASTGLNGTAMWFEAVNSVYESASTLEYRTPHTVKVEYGEHKSDATFHVNNSMTKNVTLDTEDVLVDWFVDDTIMLENVVLNVLGNITIRSGGRLTLRNFTLKIDSPGNGDRSIIVENGGELYLYGGEDNMSTLTSMTEDSSHRYRFWVKSGGMLTMEDVIVRECGYRAPMDEIQKDPSKGGLFVESDKVTIAGCLFEESYIGIIFNSTVKTSTPPVSSTTFNDAYGGIVLMNSELSLDNLMFMNLSGFGIRGIKVSSYTRLKLTDSVFTGIIGEGLASSGCILELRNCRIMNVNGTGISAVDNSSGEIYGSQLTANTNGLHMDGSTVLHIFNSSINSSTEKDIRLDGSSLLELVNTVPRRYGIDDNISKIISRYLISIHTYDNHNPEGIRYEVQETAITLEEYILDNDVLSSGRYLTDMNGERHNVMVTHQEILKDSVLTHYYNVIASKSGYENGTNNSIVFNELNRRIDMFVKDITPPEAEAGMNDEIYEGETYEFDGSYTMDNVEVTKYIWTFQYDENMKSLEGIHPTFTFDVPGRYTVTLTATDRNGNEGTDQMTLKVIMLPFEDSIYFDDPLGVVDARLFYTNRGQVPAPSVNITMHSDSIVKEKTPGLDTIGIAFSISVRNLLGTDLIRIEMRVEYGKRDISHIIDEEKLDLYMQADDGRWKKFDSFSIIDTTDKTIIANVTTTGNFTMLGPIDITPPMVLLNSIYPSRNARNVPLNVTIKVVFSENIDRDSVNRDSLVLLDPENKKVERVHSVRDNEISLTPSIDLEREKKYTVLVKANLTDLSGNRLAENVEWSFRTIEKEKPPQVLETYPENGQKNVSVAASIKIVFSKPVDNDSLENGITISPAFVYRRTLSNNGRTVEIEPQVNLEYSMTYTVTVSTDVHDLLNMTLAAVRTFNFTTEPEPPLGDDDDPEQSDKEFLDMDQALTILLILVIAILAIIIFMTFRSRFGPPSEEITEEIGEVHSCPECGEAVDPADRLCGSCGFKLKRADFVVQCPKCKTPLQPEDNKCPSCGYKQRDRTKPVPKKRTKESDEEEMEKCPFCGAETDGDADSCPVCGEAFEGEEGDFVCDKCGASVDSGEVLCPYCGEKFYEDEMVCSECGAVISSDDEMCPECGELFDEDVEIELDEDDEETDETDETEE